MDITGTPIDDTHIEKANAIYLLSIENSEYDFIKSQLYDSWVCL